MTLKSVTAAAFLGLGAALMAPVSVLNAETLRVMRGAPSIALNVPISRSAVVESDVPFAELSIAAPNIADISPLSDRTIYVLGKSPGRTSRTRLGADGRLITNVEVRVAPDISEFKERLGQILPNESIEVRTANDGIALSGQVSSIARMDRALDLAQRYAPERVSNLMVVGGNHQVMLKVRFAEMSRCVAKSLDGGLIASSSASNALLGGGTGTLRPDAPTGGSHFGKIVGVFDQAQLKAGSSIFGFDIDSVRVDILLEALEKKGLVRTLAEPNLTALSGQEATFLAGGEYPVPVAAGAERVAIEYKPFGVELAFTPRVVDGETSNIQMRAAVSAIDSSSAITGEGFTVDAFSRRETSSTVEMRDGKSFAIAGLLQDDFNDVVSQVPWLGDIPVLGSFFRSASYNRDQSELVIIVTPHIVTPVSGDTLALPKDRVRLPSESDLFLFARVTGTTPTTGAAGEGAKQDFSGREVGESINEGGFGNPTLNNMLVMTGQRSAAIDLGQRFAAKVPTTITFAFNSADLDGPARQVLAKQAAFMRQFPEVRFRVYGHTDAVGSDSYNKRLGLARAKAAVRFRANQGVSRGRLEAVVSFGETQPIIVTQDREHRNRRTVTEVSGFVQSHPTVMQGKYAEIVFREYTESATELKTAADAGDEG